MITDDDDFLAMQYAYGIADAGQTHLVEARMTADPEFSARVTEYDLLFAGLESALSSDVTQALPRPSPGLWDRIDRAIDDIENAPDTQTVRSAERAWEPFLPGVHRKVLRADRSAGAMIALYRLDPGAHIIAHCHGIAEESLVLEGAFEIDGMVCRAGDMHIAFAGSRHGALTSRTGALLYVRGDLEPRL